MQNPFLPWRLLGDSGTPSISVIAAVPGQNAVFAISTDYIQLLTFAASGPDACGSLAVSVVTVAQVGYDWGRVTGLTVSPALNSIFVGTAFKGTLQVLTESGQVLPISGVGNSTTALMWIESWRVLYVSNDQSLYTVSMDVGSGLVCQFNS